MSETSWCLSGELEKETSERLEMALDDIVEQFGVFPPTSARFEQKDTPLWKIDIYFPEKPEDAFVDAIVAAANTPNWGYTLAPVEDRDWVSESQKLLAPVSAGRFFVFGSHDADKRKADRINLQIDAGQAFGTGKHETTAACLTLLDGLAGEINPKRIFDIGTGTGVLALGAHRLWPNAFTLASDIDPIAVEVSRDNLKVNGAVEVGGNDAGIRLMVADGVNTPEIQALGQFDLVIANILAGPLIEMASDIFDTLAPGGTLLLSGLLITQEKDVADAYLACGATRGEALHMGEWSAITFTK